MFLRLSAGGIWVFFFFDFFFAEAAMSHDESDEYYYDGDGGSGYGDSYADESCDGDMSYDKDVPPPPAKPDMLYLPSESRSHSKVRLYGFLSR